MSVLLLRLAGPLQAWGDSSRFSVRGTRTEPTKSGVLGLLAAAEGRRRTEQIEDLAALRCGVRTDQEGRLLRDFHTAEGAPLSNRYYLMDAVFLVGVEGDHRLLEALHQAILHPKYPLYLGRRSCPTQGRVTLGLAEGTLVEALRGQQWLAAGWYRRQQPKQVQLPIIADADPGSLSATEQRPDVPISFSQERRLYGWRNVERLSPIDVPNPEGRDDIDFFSAVRSA